MKHLHQPWKQIYDFKNEGENYIDIYDNRGVRFASVYCEQKEDSKIRGNLFLLAPELLEVLEELADAFYFHASDNSLLKEENLMTKVADVINKAKGIM